MRRARRCVVLAAVALAACSAPPDPRAREAYVAEIEAYRAQRIERLEGSWLQIAGLFWLQPGENPFGGADDNAIVFPADAAPAHAGVFLYEDGAVTMVPEPGAGVEVDGREVGPMPLPAGDDATQVRVGRLTFWVIEREGRHAIRLKDPQFRARTEFRGIDFYPVDPDVAVDGRLALYEEPHSVPIETVIGYGTTMTSKGKVEFTLDGKQLSLEALIEEPDAQELFLIFKDGTSGTETYAAGRYLYASFEGNRVRLDFNKAYNPPCAFTPYATCPLPPAGNTLPIDLRAGERAYHLD